MVVNSMQKPKLSLKERLRRMEPKKVAAGPNTYVYGVDFDSKEDVNQFIDDAKNLYQANTFERTNRSESQDWGER